MRTTTFFAIISVLGPSYINMYKSRKLSTKDPKRLHGPKAKQKSSPLWYSRRGGEILHTMRKWMNKKERLQYLAMLILGV